MIAYIDGGARGNPGPAGFGVRIEDEDGTLIEEFSEAIDVATNNVAEYRGLLAALRWAKARAATTLHVRSDSLLLVQQMKGIYKRHLRARRPRKECPRRSVGECGNGFRVELTDRPLPL